MCVDALACAPQSPAVAEHFLRDREKTYVDKPLMILKRSAGTHLKHPLISAKLRNDAISEWVNNDIVCSSVLLNRSAGVAIPACSSV